MDCELVSTSESHLKMDENNKVTGLTINKGRYVLDITSTDGLDFHGTYDDPYHKSGRDTGTIYFKHYKDDKRHCFVGYCQWQGNDGNPRRGLYHIELEEIEES